MDDRRGGRRDRSYSPRRDRRGGGRSRSYSRGRGRDSRSGSPRRPRGRSPVIRAGFEAGGERDRGGGGRNRKRSASSSSSARAKKKRSGFGQNQGFDQNQMSNAYAAMQQQLATPVPISMPQENPEVERFLQFNQVQPHAATSLRNLPFDQQAIVLSQGSLFNSRDPTAVLLGRIQKASRGITTAYPFAGKPATPRPANSNQSEMSRLLGGGANAGNNEGKSNWWDKSGSWKDNSATGSWYNKSWNDSSGSSKNQYDLEFPAAGDAQGDKEWASGDADSKAQNSKMKMSIEDAMKRGTVQDVEEKREEMQTAIDATLASLRTKVSSGDGADKEKGDGDADDNSAGDTAASTRNSQTGAGSFNPFHRRQPETAKANPKQPDSKEAQEKYITLASMIRLGQPDNDHSDLPEESAAEKLARLAAMDGDQLESLASMNRQPEAKPLELMKPSTSVNEVAATEPRIVLPRQKKPIPLVNAWSKLKEDKEKQEDWSQQDWQQESGSGPQEQWKKEGWSWGDFSQAGSEQSKDAAEESSSWVMKAWQSASAQAASHEDSEKAESSKEGEAATKKEQTEQLALPSTTAEALLGAKADKPEDNEEPPPETPEERKQRKQAAAKRAQALAALISFGLHDPNDQMDLTKAVHAMAIATGDQAMALSMYQQIAGEEEETANAEAIVEQKPAEPETSDMSEAQAAEVADELAIAQYSQFWVQQQFQAQLALFEKESLMSQVDKSLVTSVEHNSEPMKFGGQKTKNTPRMIAGDWICPGCGDHQFARNRVCRHCGVHKPPLSKILEELKEKHKAADEYD